MHCPYINGRGRCDVYEDRPIMCRIFGTAPANQKLRCPHGCAPMNPLTPDQARDIMARYIEVFF